MASITQKTAVYGVLLIIACVAQQLKAVDQAVDPASPRTCYSCNGIDCLRMTKLNVTTQCGDLLDYCATVFKGFTVVARGCYSDLGPAYREKCDLGDHPECVKCFGNRCNDKGRADFKCIECKSSENKKCATDTSDMTAVQCPIPTAQNSYCYVRESSEEGTTRGCFVHLREQQVCLSDPKCSMCLSDDAEACNTYKVAAQSASYEKNSGSDINIASMSLLTLAAFVARFI